MYKKNPNIVDRVLHDSIFLINITDNFSSARCYLHEINQVGYFLWMNIDKCETISDLVRKLQAILTEPVEEAILKEDISDFVNDLISRGYISSERE